LELADHMKRHSSERPFKCVKSSCGKAFKSKDVLTHHMNTAHSYERPFKCPEPDCDKEYKDQDGLTRHLKEWRHF
jgi:uncharacterized Zn-finger protein